MARQPRYVLPGQVQHVIQRGNNHAEVFLREEDYHFYLECLREACGANAVDLHAYALMPNHVHLLLTPKRQAGVSKVMQSIGGRYAQYINSRYRRTGTVWGGRYRSTVIDPVHYLLPCMRYVELNPVRAGVVSRPRDYRWSSYLANAEGLRDLVVTPHPIYLHLANTPEARRAGYLETFRSPVDEGMLTDIRNCTNKGWVLGDLAFRERLAVVANRRVHPLPRGGDRRSARNRPQSAKASDPFGFGENDYIGVREEDNEPFG